MNREEAINVVRNIYQTDKEKEALSILIPELAESEDERIRKELLCHIQGEIDTYDNMISGDYDSRDKEDKKVHEMLKRARAYLEKQKELDKMIVVSPEVWDNAISDAFENGKKEGEKQKPAEKSSMLKKLKEHLANTPREQLDAEFEVLKDLTIDKPAEWKAEDYEMLHLIIDYFESTKIPMKINTRDKVVDFKEIAEWLKSLRPQPHWKPSEEQMEAFEDALVELFYWHSREEVLPLKNLFDDLKKL